ncbi:hypothetical protein [Streptomyces roseicoloratus]|uniref:hypothetical protein n=1 Tax=Streptomyces roseicoloratus TaxID=2508722 RepID=UPI001009E23F|nr:hypothetical protein [Streptomyces roseicoloratus]
MRPHARFALAVLLVLAALLGVGTGGGPAAAEGEIRSVSAVADPGAETHEAAESESAAPARGDRRAAPSRPTRPAPPAVVPAPAPAPVPVPTAPGAVPRSAVMRC